MGGLIIAEINHFDRSLKMSMRRNMRSSFEGIMGKKYYP